MTVLSIGYPLFPVAVDASGGAEQVLLSLERHLHNGRHGSIVIAAEGSRVAGRLIATPVLSGQIEEEHRVWAREQHRRAIEAALRENHIDLIHFHGLDFYDYVPETDVPKIATLHLPLAWYPESVMQNSSAHLNCVSASQAWGTSLPVVPNGIDIERFRPSSSRQDFLFWLGRICPEKGVHLALELAHRTDSSLLVAGPIHPFAAHQQYFADQVKPLLDARRQYIGPACGARKTHLLAEARALLVTSLVAETSSLVAMEAIASGTPVLALRSGALPEVVEHGMTGFVADSADELATYVTELRTLSPSLCRAIACERFSDTRMYRNYLALYSRVLGMASAPHDCLYASSPLRKFQAV